MSANYTEGFSFRDIEMRNQEIEDLARYYMWEKVIPGYSNLSQRQKKHCKEKPQYCPMFFSPTEEDYSKAEQHVINFKPNSCINPFGGYNKKKEEQEMSYMNKSLASSNINVDVSNNSNTIEVSQREYLRERVSDIRLTQLDRMDAKYFKLKPKGPRTKADLLDALKNGKFTIKDDYFRENGELDNYIDVLYTISWRTADTQYDKAGWTKAREELKAKETATLDAVNILPLVDALKAVQDFEAAEF